MDHTRRYERIRSLAGRIALMGGRRVNGAWEAPWVPSCDSPVWVLHSTPRTDRGQWTTARKRPYDVGMFVPCRKCARCLQIRQMQWRTRILSEARLVPFNYFLTLTFSPAHLAGVLAEAQKRKDKSVEGAGYRHVSLYLKRLRKGRKMTSRGVTKDSLGRTRQAFDPLKFRFFAAAEYGDLNGRLHFHLMLHCDRWIPPEVFQDEWRSRATAELVKSTQGCATYVSKYLTKDQTPGRARASLRYGQESPTVKGLSEQSGQRRQTAQPPGCEGGPGMAMKESPLGELCERGVVQPHSRPSLSENTFSERLGDHS